LPVPSPEPLCSGVVMPKNNYNQAAKPAIPLAADTMLNPPATRLAPSQGGQWRLSLPVTLLVAAAAALVIDCPLARWCLEGNCPEFLEKLLHICEPFGHGLGVLVIVLAIHQLDPARRGALPRVLACSWGAGLAADLIKMLVVRVRPHHFSFEGGVWTTFGGWLPLTGAGSGGQSFPSAHTATAVGLAVALVWLYPAGGRLFAALAVLVACQRIAGGAHYLSDVLCGAAVGILVARVFVRGKGEGGRGRGDTRLRAKGEGRKGIAA